VANFTLQITYPLPPDVAGTGLDADHAVYYAHPDVPYRTVAAFIGGDGVIQWSMSGQPSGMTIDSDTGAIYWAAPTAGIHTGITITATDSANATDSISYDLTVTTTGFVFIDADAVDDTGTGAIGDPWKTIDRLYDDTNDVRAYFREGTYTFAGVTNTPGAGDPDFYSDRYFFSQAAGRCTDWRAYPGETVVLDFESDHSTVGNPPAGMQPSLRLNGPRNHVDGFVFDNGWNKYLWMDRTNNYGIVVTNNTFRNMGPGVNGSNSANVMMTALSGVFSYHDVLAANQIANLGITNGTTCFLKGYTMKRPYIAFNTGSDSIIATETIALKGNVTEFNVYRNNIDAVVPCGGDHHGTIEEMTGEFRFNRFKGTTSATDFNQFGNGGAMWWIRNTIQGPIRARNVGTGVHDPDGPFTWYNNVIVNEDGSGSPWNYMQDEMFGDDVGTIVAEYVDCVTTGSPTGTQNLAGNAAAGIVDSSGLLTGSYRTSYLGSWGHEIVGVQSSNPKRRYRRFRLRS